MYLLHECDAGLVIKSNQIRKSPYEIKSLIEVRTCKVCDDWLHIEQAKTTKEEYRKYTNTFPDNGVFFMSADMEKVNMLPRIPCIKTAISTRRIIMYHETSSGSPLN